MGEAERWLKRFKKLSDDIPDGMEAIVGYSSVSLYERGRLRAHLGSSENGYGIPDDGTEIESITINPAIIPYSEGT